MKELTRALAVAWVGVCASVLAACSGQVDRMLDDYLPEKEPAYKSSKRLPPLEVPPDLTQSAISDSLRVPNRAQGGTTYSDYANKDRKGTALAESGEVLPDFTNIRIERENDTRWLVIDAAPAQVWPRLRDFWLEQGFIIETEDPSIGIMETDWAEKRASMGSGVLSRLFGQLSSSLYGAALRDKFRTRLERADQRNATEVYVSHRGAEEIARTVGYSTAERYEEKAWQPRPSDPELEAEMLSRMMVFFGLTEQRAGELIAQEPAKPDRARMVQEASGASVLAIDDDFSRAWRRTGLALDRVGFTVEDRDRSRGLYFVRYIDPETDVRGENQGFFSQLKFWESDKPPEAMEFLISVVGDDRATQVIVLDKEGNRETSETADRILALLHEQLR